MPRATGICDQVLTATYQHDHKGSDELQVTIVPDLAQDSRFCERPYVQNPPYNRFYAGVSIRSPRGIPIGVLAVWDDKPRDELDAGQLRFLRSISQTVMDHWAAKASTINYRRSERSKWASQFSNPS